MHEFGIMLAAALIPALGNLAGGLAAEFLPFSAKSESLALHAAAGVVLAVVAVEIMPRSLAAATPWIPVLAFFLGSVFFVMMDHAVGLVQARFGGASQVTEKTEGLRERNPAEGASRASWLIYFGVAVDLFSDGLMVGTGSTIALSLGFLLALGQSFADLPEGFATIIAFKRQGMKRKARLLVAASFFIPILAGALLGFLMLRGKPPLWQYSVLAFTAGILLTMIAEEMIPEAHKEEDPALAALFLSGGFSLFTLVSVYAGP